MIAENRIFFLYFTFCLNLNQYKQLCKYFIHFMTSDFYKINLIKYIKIPFLKFSNLKIYSAKENGIKKINK